MEKIDIVGDATGCACANPAPQALDLMSMCSRICCVYLMSEYLRNFDGIRHNRLMNLARSANRAVRRRSL